MNDVLITVRSEIYFIAKKKKKKTMVKQILHNMRPLGQGTGSRYFSIRQEQIHA